MNACFDYALVGGGLQNGLIALALRARQPNARIALIERGGDVGGNHTWSFHAGDLPDGAAAWVDPLVVARWPGYEVAFPSQRRFVDLAYASVASSRFAECVVDALATPGSQLFLETTVEEVEAHRVFARAGTTSITLEASAVIDARGPDQTAAEMCGWQKFLGQELLLTAPHGLTSPTLMDATISQRDGFHFMYVLPLAPDRLLVEDTYFSDGSYLDATACRGAIAAYVAARGLASDLGTPAAGVPSSSTEPEVSTAKVVREESGILPMPWSITTPVPRAPLVAGYAGGWFHPVTGYSFPIATRLAAVVASLPAARLFGPELAAFAAAHARQLGFAKRLTYMLFHWFPPDQRHHVLARFYRLPEASIRRFYALQLTTGDWARLFSGRPPRGLSWRAVLGLEAR